MKRFLLILAAAWVAALAQATGSDAPKEVSSSVLRVAPEKYQRRLITYSDVYRNFATTFPRYMEASGISSPRWIRLMIGDAKLPVLMKKTDKAIALVADLKPGTKVMVTGRIREFKIDPNMADAIKAKIRFDAHYYMEATMIEPVPAKQQPQQPSEQQQAKPQEAPIKPAAEPPPF